MILRGGKFAVFIEQGISSLLNFVFPIAISRKFGDEQLSQYFYAISFALVVQAAIRSLIVNPYILFSKTTSVNIREIYESIIMLLVTITLLSSACIFFVYFYSVSSNASGSSQAVFLGIFFIGWISRDAVRAILAAEGKYIRALQFSCIVFILHIILYVTVAVYKNISFINVLILLYIFPSLMMLYIFILRLKANSFRVVRICWVAKKHIKYGWYSAVNNLLQSGLTLLVITLIGKYGSDNDVAIYGTLWAFCNVGSPLYQAVNTFLSRKLVDLYASHGIARLKYYVRDTILKMGLLGFINVLFFSILGSYLYREVYENKYDVNGWYFFIVSLSISMQGTGYPISRMMNAISVPSETFKSGIVYSACVIFSFFIAIYDPILSAILMILFGRTIALIYQIWTYRRESE